jgi:hypothetical protein
LSQESQLPYGELGGCPEKIPHVCDKIIPINDKTFPTGPDPPQQSVVSKPYGCGTCHCLKPACVPGELPWLDIDEDKAIEAFINVRYSAV